LWTIGSHKGIQMQPIANLQSKHGHCTTIGYDFKHLFQELAESGEADVGIVSTEDGFSPLGASRQFFTSDLGIPDAEIRRLANWNRSENKQVTLVALGSRNANSLLKGIILAPGANTLSYQQFPTSVRCHRPYRDFYYNVSYEAISFACKQWGARKLAISHLSGSGSYHEDIATCHAEALAHFCDIEPVASPDSFVFCGCCITAEHLDGIRRLNVEGARTAHFPIQTAIDNKEPLAKLFFQKTPNY